MKADDALKALVAARPPDLLPLFGDRGATVRSWDSPELSRVTRRADIVLSLSRGRECHLRHVEFEMRWLPRIALRMHEYAALIARSRRMAVACTVLVLKKTRGCPAARFVVHRERVSGETECERRIRLVRVWELSPRQLRGLGAGASALTGLLERADAGDVARAARRIEREGGAGRNDLLAILRVLSEGRYTAQELERIVPFEVIMASGVLAMAKRRGLREGLRKGMREGLREGIEAARRLCLDMVEKHHPELLERVGPAAQACSDLAALTSWTLLASEGDGGSLLAAVGSSPSPAEARVAAGRSTGRSPRPARRVKSRR
jgi:hypothetical protein